jgi:hypothetical protein
VSLQENESSTKGLSDDKPEDDGAAKLIEAVNTSKDLYVAYHDHAKKLAEHTGLCAEAIIAFSVARDTVKTKLREAKQHATETAYQTAIDYAEKTELEQTVGKDPKWIDSAYSGIAARASVLRGLGVANLPTTVENMYLLSIAVHKNFSGIKNAIKKGDLATTSTREKIKALGNLGSIGSSTRKSNTKPTSAAILAGAPTYAASLQPAKTVTVTATAPPNDLDDEDDDLDIDTTGGEQGRKPAALRFNRIEAAENGSETANSEGPRIAHSGGEQEASQPVPAVLRFRVKPVKAKIFFETALTKLEQYELTEPTYDETAGTFSGRAFCRVYLPPGDPDKLMGELTGTANNEPVLIGTTEFFEHQAETDQSWKLEQAAAQERNKGNRKGNRK